MKTMLEKMILAALIAVFFTPARADAQTGVDTLQARLLATYQSGVAWLRWAPLDIPSWKTAVRHGYRLERYTLEVDSALIPADSVYLTREILAEALMPAPEAVLEAMSDTMELAGVAGAAIYGDTLETVPLTAGEMVQAVNTNRENENRYAFSLMAADESFAIAQAVALGYRDSTVAAGRVYLYRLRINGASAGQVALSAAVRLSAAAGSEDPIPEKPAAEAGDRRVILSWAKDPWYTSYAVECSDDGGQSFVARNKNPVLASDNPRLTLAAEVVYFADSLAQNGVGYIYRIRGRSPFGTYGPPSDTVLVEGRVAPLDVYPSLADIVEIPEGHFQLNWTFPSEHRDDLQGFNIFRSTQVDGPFELLNNTLLPVGDSTFTDTSPLPWNYYLVEAVDQDGAALRSFSRLAQLSDETPPAAPQHIRGFIADDGTVSLEWDANTEADLKGYRVFLSTAADGDFTQITGVPVENPAFQYRIELQTLSEKVYFKVRALDFRENNSPLSEICALDIPDKVPPVPPRITLVEPSSMGVLLQWAPSSSNDVIRHEVQRKQSFQAHWESLETRDGVLEGTQSYREDTLGGQYIWQYRILAYDEMELASSSNIVQVKPSNILRAPVEMPQAEVSTQDDRYAAKLSWHYLQIPGVHDFLIYRSKDGSDMTAHHTLPLSELEPLTVTPDRKALYSWKDIDIKTGSQYEYKIVARYLDGGTSPLSEAASVGF